MVIPASDAHGLVADRFSSGLSNIFVPFGAEAERVRYAEQNSAGLNE